MDNGEMKTEVWKENLTKIIGEKDLERAQKKKKRSLLY